MTAPVKRAAEYNKLLDELDSELSMLQQSTGQMNDADVDLYADNLQTVDHDSDKNREWEQWLISHQAETDQAEGDENDEQQVLEHDDEVGQERKLSTAKLVSEVQQAEEEMVHDTLVELNGKEEDEDDNQGAPEHDDELEDEKKITHVSRDEEREEDEDLEAFNEAEEPSQKEVDEDDDQVAPEHDDEVGEERAAMAARNKEHDNSEEPESDYDEMYDKDEEDEEGSDEETDEDDEQAAPVHDDELGEERRLMKKSEAVDQNEDMLDILTGDNTDDSNKYMAAKEPDNEQW